MKIVSCWIILVFSLFIFSSSSLQAFSNPLDSKKMDVQILSSAGESFDDNITYVSQSEKSDFITELMAGLRLRHETQRTAGMLEFQDIQQIFGRYSDFNNNAQRAAANFEWALSKKSRLNFEDQFSHTEEARSFEDEFGRSRGRYSSLRNQAQLRLTQDLSRDFEFEIGYENTFNLFSRDDLRDSLQQKTKAKLNWLRSSASIFALVYQWTHQQFEQSSIRGDDSAFSNGMGGSVKHYLTSRLSAEFGGGMDLIHNFENENVLRPYLDAVLEQELDAKTKAKLLAFEWRSQANAYESSIFETWRISSGVERELRKRLKANLQAFFGSGKYRELDIRDQLYGIRTWIQYEMRPELFLTLSYSLSITDSDQPNRDYIKNVTNLKISYTI